MKSKIALGKFAAMGLLTGGLVTQALALSVSTSCCGISFTTVCPDSCSSATSFCSSVTIGLTCTVTSFGGSCDGCGPIIIIQPDPVPPVLLPPTD